MSELPNDEEPLSKPRELDEEVGAREARKIRARRKQDRTIWFGLGMFGLIGWTVAVPTLLGVAVGWWLDRTWPARFSWTLALLLGGVALGCMNAWYWVSREREAMEEERKDDT